MGKTDYRQGVKYRRHFSAYVYPFSRAFAWGILKYFVRSRAYGHQEINKSKRAGVVVANHQCDFDPFLLNSKLRRPIRFLMSDANLRSPIRRAIFGFFGVIAKTKNMNDTQALRVCQRALGAGELIGIFGEGQSTWDGHTLPFSVPTFKLIRLFRTDVYTCHIFGTYFIQPRWGRGIRSGRVIFRFQRIITAEEASKLPLQEIQARVEGALSGSVYTEQMKHHYRYIYRQQRSAEHCESLLFVCPQCRRIGTVWSRGNTILCRRCGELAVMNQYALLHFHAHLPVSYVSMEEWNRWQVGHWHTVLAQHAAPPAAPAATPVAAARASRAPVILAESPVLLQRGYRTDPLTEAGRGVLTLQADTLALWAFKEGEDPNAHTLWVNDGITAPADAAPPTAPASADPIFSAPISELQGINTQRNELLEFYYNNTLYQVVIDHTPRNSYKWLTAIEYLRDPHNDAPAAK